MSTMNPAKKKSKTSSKAALRTRFTQAFKCRVPIMGAPMAGVSGGALAAATWRGGALGFIAAGYLTDEDELRREIKIFRKEASEDAPLCLGFISFASMADGPEKLVSALTEHKPFAVQFFAPAVFGDNISLAKGLGAKVIAQVGCERDAREAFAAGTDCVVAQGREAGGHGLRSDLGSSTLPLAARISNISKEYGDSSFKPMVLAAGGIVDGRGLASALALGCDGCVFGTRLWASNEALGHKTFKQRLVDSGPDDILRTMAFDKIMNSYSQHKLKWQPPFDSVGVVANQTTELWHDRLDDLDMSLKESDDVATAHRAAVVAGDADIARVYSGEGVGCIDSISSAEIIIKRAEEEAVATIMGLQTYCITD